MTQPIPDYARRRIDLELQRRRHRREAHPLCNCLICNPTRDITAEILDRVRVNSERIGEAPF